MKINLYLETPSTEEPSTVLDIEPKEENLLPNKVRQIVESTGSLILEGATWNLLQSPIFWSIALASKADILNITLHENESTSSLEEKLKRVRQGLTTVDQSQELDFIG